MIEPLTLAQIGISIFGCTAFLLVTRDSRRAQVAGVVCGLISNPFWWLMVIVTEQWITAPLHLAYTYGWLSKAYRLWKSRQRSIDIKLTGRLEAWKAGRLNYGMSLERQKEADRTGQLTPEEAEAGWHFCAELDYALENRNNIKEFCQCFEWEGGGEYDH